MDDFDVVISENFAFGHFNTGWLWMRKGEVTAAAWQAVLDMDLVEVSRDQVNLNTVRSPLPTHFTSPADANIARRFSVRSTTASKATTRQRKTSSPTSLHRTGSRCTSSMRDSSAPTIKGTFPSSVGTRASTLYVFLSFLPSYLTSFLPPRPLPPLPPFPLPCVSHTVLPYPRFISLTSTSRQHSTCCEDAWTKLFVAKDEVRIFPSLSLVSSLTLSILIAGLLDRSRRLLLSPGPSSLH
jgi:hypothetical protein